MNISSSKYRWMGPAVKDLEPGVAYEAVRGKQFDCEPMSFTNVVYRVAKEMGWKATLVTFPDRVVYAFYRPESYLRPNLAAYPVVRKMKGN